MSLLGLDTLAATKRENTPDRGSTPKRSKLMSYRNDSDDDDIEEDSRGSSRRSDRDREDRSAVCFILLNLLYSN